MKLPSSVFYSFDGFLLRDVPALALIVDAANVSYALVWVRAI